MELWFVLAILVVVLWGSDGIFAKLSTPKLGVARIAILMATVEVMMYFVGFYLWRSNVPLSLEIVLLAEISCMIGMIGYLCYFESISDGQIAIVGTISAGYPALTVIGAIAFLSETLSVAQIFAVVAIIGGVIALSYEPNPGSQHAISKRSVFFALLAFGFWGIWSLTSKMAISMIGAGNIFGLYVISSLTIPPLYASFRKLRPRQDSNDNPSSRAWAFGAIALALNVCGIFALSLALESGFASLVFTISSAYPLVTVILAVGLLHEKLNKLHVIALVFVILGLIGIGTIG